MTDGDHSGRFFCDSARGSAFLFRVNSASLNNGSCFGAGFTPAINSRRQLAAELGLTDFGSRRSSYEVLVDCQLLRPWRFQGIRRVA